MSIVDNILGRFGYVSPSQLNAQISEAVKQELAKVERWQAETAEVQKWHLPDPQIYANQADLYRLSPILGTALDVLAGDIGTSTFNVKRMVGEEERDIPNHPFEMLLRTPNPLDSGLELMQYTTSNYKLNGNSIWWLNREGPNAEVDEIWPMPFSQVQPVPDGQLYLSHYNYFPGGSRRAIRFETWEVTHFKTYNPLNRFVGLSPIESLAMTIQGDLAMRKTNTVNYAEYGGAPQSILAFKDWVPNDAWNDIKAEKRQAAKRNEMMMLRGVGDGVTWLQRALSNKDMDFVAGLRQNMTDVFNRMCPGLLAMLDPSSTEANALAARATYAEKTLWVMMETIAQKVTSDILPAYGRKLKGEFGDPRVVDRKLQLEEQAAFERTHTIEEVRAQYYEDDPIGDDRDKLFVTQLNAQSGGIQKPPPSPFGGGEQPAEEMPDADNEDGDVSAKAVSVETHPAVADLLTWRRMAMRGKAEKSMAFKSTVIPEPMMRSIKGKLGVLTDRQAIASVFDQAIEGLKPRPQLDPLLMLKGIEQGVRALEARNKGS